MSDTAIETAPVKRSVGRPTKYREEFPEQAYRHCLLGATDAEIALLFDVNEDTVHEWKKVHPEFSESLTRGKAEADANVAESLYKRALGYSHEAVKIFMPAGFNEPVYAPYTEHFPPDTAAASLWLRNRRPDKWRDKIDISAKSEMTVHVTDSLDLAQLNADQREALREIAQALIDGRALRQAQIGGDEG